MKDKKSPKAKKDHSARRKIASLFRWGMPVPVLLLVAIAAVLFAVPPESLRVLGLIVGVLLIAAALVLIATAFTGKIGIPQIVIGVGLIAFSVWLFVQPEEASSALRYALTALVLLRAVLGFLYALLAKRKENRLWQISMAGSILLAIFCVVLFCLPPLRADVLNLLLGVLCCVNAAAELVALLHRALVLRQERKEEKAELRAERKKEEKEKDTEKEKGSARERDVAEEQPSEEKEEERKGGFWRRFVKRKDEEDGNGQ